MILPMLVVAVLLLLAVLFLVLGTLRGSFRVWLVGYALVVAGLVVVYASIHETQARAPVVQPAGNGAGS